MKLVDLTHHIKRLAAEGVELCFTGDDIGLCLHFSSMFRDREIAKMVTWEQLIASNFSLLDKAINDSVAKLKEGLDPFGPPSYTLPTNVVTLDQFRGRQ